MVRRGAPERVLVSLARELGAERVHFSADVGPFARARDERVSLGLRQAGIEVHVHPGLFVADDLGAIRTARGTPYTVFTPFYRDLERGGAQGCRAPHRGRCRRLHPGSTPEPCQRSPR